MRFYCFYRTVPKFLLLSRTGGVGGMGGLIASGRRISSRVLMAWESSRSCFLREICGKAASGFCENSVSNEIRFPSVCENSCYKSLMKL